MSIYDLIRKYDFANTLEEYVIIEVYEGENYIDTYEVSRIDQIPSHLFYQRIDKYICSGCNEIKVKLYGGKYSK